MISWLTIGLAGIWPLVWKLSLSTLVGGGLIAAYFFMPAPIALMFPNLRKWLLPAAGVIFAAVFFYAAGVADEHNRNVAREVAATTNAYADARKAAADAPLQVAKQRAAAQRKPSVWVRSPKRDGYDRSQER